MMFSNKGPNIHVLGGGKRCVGDNLALVLFKHQWLNGFLHNVTYVNVR